MVGIEEMIFLNQWAQGLRSSEDVRDWMSERDEAQQREVLEHVAEMCRQAGALDSDVADAIAESGLKATYTSCVLLSKPPLKAQYYKIVGLPERERKRSLLLLLTLYRLANARRVRESPASDDRHWWNWDLGDEGVLSTIRTRYHDGTL